MTSTPAIPTVAPAYLFDVPKNVLKGTAKGIVKWCAANNKVPPTLLHLELARKARGLR